MIEKVNPSHPDKVADRIAGAIVDLAYTKEISPKIAVEVLIGHGVCNVIIESGNDISRNEVRDILERVAGKGVSLNLISVPQDKSLSDNQNDKVRCGDNGIFKGVPINEEEAALSKIARGIYKEFPTDGKYLLDDNKLIVCQSNAERVDDYGYDLIFNPLGYWTGGLDVDTGATNRKLGSDMGRAVTGGGLHGKDLSKADVSVNIYAHLKAQETGEVVELCCAIGDEYVDGKPYDEIVKIAEGYINELGGFEKLAEWGLF